jgi:transcriptional regulator with XRE-family HTH domain
MNAKVIISELLALGLTQMEMERRTGIDQSTISAIYTGRRGKRVSYDVMSRLANLLAESKAAAEEGS